MCACAFEEDLLQRNNRVGNFRACLARPETDIGRDLIVAAAGSMEAATHVLATPGVLGLKNLTQS